MRLGLERLPFVIIAFAGAESDEQLGTPMRPVNLERNDCDPLGGSRSRELLDFPFMGKQCSWPDGVMLEG